MAIDRRLARLGTAAGRAAIAVGMLSVVLAARAAVCPAVTSPAAYVVTVTKDAKGVDVRLVSARGLVRVVRTAWGLGIDRSSAVSWSADRAFLAWTEVGRRDLTLWVAGGDGSNPHPLLRITDFALGPLRYSWSRRGHTLAVANADGHGHRVRMVNAATGAIQDITPAHEPAQTYLSAPEWSPSGNSIIYIRQGESGTAKGMECWPVVGRPDGSRLHTLPVKCGRPFWSSDGRRLALTTDPDGRRDVKPLVILEIASGNTLSLDTNAHHDGVHGDVVWSPDGRRLAFGTRHGAMTVAVNGTSQRRIHGSHGWSQVVDWRPDGAITLIRDEKEIIQTTDRPAAKVRVIYRVLRGEHILRASRR